MKIALIGNPNCGKTTVFNELTGSAQYVGNWPGVTVEKKSGKLVGHREIEIIDLPGIYSLSPYTLEEVITRDYLVNEHPDVIINIVDALNLERNLYLTTQVIETEIPVVMALNMMDLVAKNHDKINISKLSETLGCSVVETSAVKGIGMENLIETAIKVGASANKIKSVKIYSDKINDSIQEINEIIGNNYSPYYAVKAFERDEKALDKLLLSASKKTQIEEIIKSIEKIEDDDSESIITNERYSFVTSILEGIYTKNNKKNETTSDKIDKIVTNKYLALPIFFCIMWFIYYISISTIGDMTIGFVESTFENLHDIVATSLESAGASEIVVDLVASGIIDGIGAIFPFVPQLMILFFFLSLLEDSGYMARVAFIMDRIFRRFGLSGKSFIPMLIGTGCSIPGIMAARTIENETDRKMTIMLTPFIPCGAKLPVFSMFISMMFSEATWVAPTIYMIGILGVIISGIVLKRTKRFKGDPAPFVMELPTYKIPRLKGVIIHMWEKAKSFIIKAGTVIFVACLAIWFLRSFSFSLEYLGEEGIADSMLAQIGETIRFVFIPMGFGDSWAPAVASITGLIAKEVVVSTFVTVGSIIPLEFSQITAFAFMVFTIFAAPCFAAIGAMKRELGNWKDTGFALAFQTGTAYVLASLVNIIGNIIFKGTEIAKKIPLDYELMEEASEAVELDADLLPRVFIAIVVIAFIVVIADKLTSVKKYSSINTTK